MHCFGLCLSNYLNIISNKRRHAIDIQDGEKYKMAATFHIMSFIEPIIKYFNNNASLANWLVLFTFVNQRQILYVYKIERKYNYYHHQRQSKIIQNDAKNVDAPTL